MRNVQWDEAQTIAYIAFVTATSPDQCGQYGQDAQRKLSPTERFHSESFSTAIKRGQSTPTEIIVQQPTD